ncbi:unnamed protein product [Bursaphelenchus okinawaensis]|uniref:Uncharacterized protein n=1 Tax=Bursaphelenchus okinawaensis TaxID=465554 RepID=A0A811JRM8_9BILA|nr:unnamed protein product [Bursaphelenchus okinawaensis]CAG9079987.1 unnamed protein product [Bursaphelenchus okinawaensis]
MEQMEMDIPPPRRLKGNSLGYFFAHFLLSRSESKSLPFIYHQFNDKWKANRSINSRDVCTLMVVNYGWREVLRKFMQSLRREDHMEFHNSNLKTNALWYCGYIVGRVSWEPTHPANCYLIILKWGNVDFLVPSKEVVSYMNLGLLPLKPSIIFDGAKKPHPPFDGLDCKFLKFIMESEKSCRYFTCSCT